jgi:hypothetical protein
VTLCSGDICASFRKSSQPNLKTQAAAKRRNYILKPNLKTQAAAKHRNYILKPNLKTQVIEKRSITSSNRI